MELGGVLLALYVVVGDFFILHKRFQPIGMIGHQVFTMYLILLLLIVFACFNTHFYSSPYNLRIIWTNLDF